jgi:hypothetical protein
MSPKYIHVDFAFITRALAVVSPSFSAGARSPCADDQVVLFPVVPLVVVDLDLDEVRLDVLRLE